MIYCIDAPASLSGGCRRVRHKAQVARIESHLAAAVCFADDGTTMIGSSWWPTPRPRRPMSGCTTSCTRSRALYAKVTIHLFLNVSPRLPAHRRRT
jgi:hypothetical protein